MAPPFSSCLGFVFLTGHPDEDIFSPSLSPSNHSIKCKGLWKCPRSSISAIFSHFQSAFPGIILFNLSNNGGHREHTNLRPHLQMRKLKLKGAEMLSQDCCTSPRCRTGTCRQELVGRGHPHPPYENGLPGRALCRKKTHRSLQPLQLKKGFGLGNECCVETWPPAHFHAAYQEGSLPK